MSRARDRRKKPKNQKAKLLVIPLLLVVLGYVLFSSSGSEEDADTAVPSNTPGTNGQTSAQPAAHSGSSLSNSLPPAGRKLVSTAATPTANAQPLASWPRADLSQLGKVSPFASTASLTPEPPVAEIAPIEEPISHDTAEIEPLPLAPALDLNQLSQQPVHYYFQSRTRRIMLLGEHLLSEGQSLENYTVKQLEPTRVQLESLPEVEPQPTAIVPPIQD